MLDKINGQFCYQSDTIFFIICLHATLWILRLHTTVAIFLYANVPCTHQTVAATTLLLLKHTKYMCGLFAIEAKHQLVIKFNRCDYLENIQKYSANAMHDTTHAPIYWKVKRKNHIFAEECNRLKLQRFFSSSFREKIKFKLKIQEQFCNNSII